MSDQLPLFVFGTLRRGHCNHHYLAGHFARVQPAWLDDFARLHELMIVQRPGSSVDGELFDLIPNEYVATLAGCDQLEEIPPGQLVGHEYRRKRVTVRTEAENVTAWAYVHPDTPADD
jgi:gamma-glutamylcyclotransferase (GGCT)/AIG2-like uncharacterized protein YtfP